MSDIVRESAAAYGATPRRMTVREYYLAAENGVFKPGERLELIRGEVFQKVSPQKSTHASATYGVAKTLERTFGAGFHVRQQMPLRLDETNEPDVGVVLGENSDFLHDHPSARDMALVVEVSDTTLKFDRGVKSRLYAEFGIGEYWIVNLKDGKLEACRQPGHDGYGKSAEIDRSGSVTPLRASGKSVRVSDLIPEL